VRMFAAAFAALVLAGCEVADPPVCHPGIPRASQLRAEPTLSALKYHTHIPRRAMSPTAYDFWADGKYEYNLSLQYLLAPKKDATRNEDLCAHGISLRFRYPGTPADRERLRVFSRAVAPAAGLDAQNFEARMLRLIATNDKYRPRLDVEGNAKLWAGRLYHQGRGDYFVMTLLWEQPDSPFARE